MKRAGARPSVTTPRGGRPNAAVILLMWLGLFTAGCSGMLSPEMVAQFEAQHVDDLAIMASPDIPAEKVHFLIGSRIERDRILLCALGREQWCAGSP